MRAEPRPPVVGLIATVPRLAMLRRYALPSIRTQTRPLDGLIVVSDRRALTETEQRALAQASGVSAISFLRNARAAGVAGAWNTGLAEIHRTSPEAYVAILDDDDLWDPIHIALCLESAQRAGWADVVVSGLRLTWHGRPHERVAPTDLTVADFLVGNPGWQGSNTFVRVETLRQVGGFTDGLVSTNDRDLAIRLLSAPGVRVSYTGQFSATWQLNAAPDALSDRGSPRKLEGLRQFFRLHGHRMSTPIRQRFFARCTSLFGFSEADVSTG